MRLKLSNIQLNSKYLLITNVIFLSFSRVYHFTVTVGGLFCIFGNRKSYKIKHLDKRSRAKKFECENLTGTEAPQMGVSVNPQAPVAQKVAD